MDDAALKLDHERHVLAAEQHGIDVEEVGDHNSVGLG